MPEPEHIDRRRAALIAYDVCRRALAPSDPTRRAAMRPVLDAWVKMIAAARAASVPVIYTTPVSRADGADVVMLPTDLSAETGVPPLTNAVEGTAEAGFPDEIAPRPRGLRLPQAPAERLLRDGRSRTAAHAAARHDHHRRRRHQSRRRDERPRGLQPRPRVCRGARMLLERRPRRPRLQPRQGDENVRAHPKPRPGRGDAAGMRGHRTMSRPRAADDFKTIRTRMEELRRERLPEQPAPVTGTPTTDTGVAFHRGPCACGRSLFPDECDGSLQGVLAVGDCHSTRSGIGSAAPTAANPVDATAGGASTEPQET